MTYWIPAYVDLPRHPKTRRLARALDASIPATVGHLVCLWSWCMDFAGDGGLAGMEDRDIADAAEWEGDASALVTALLTSGWLDDDRRIHDWDQYGGRVLKEQQRRAAHMRAVRAGHSTARDGHVTVTGPSREIHVTTQNRTEQNRTEHAPKGADAAGAASPRAVPKPNKLAEVIDAIRAGGGDVSPSKADAAAVKGCGAPASLIAEAHLAASRGRWPPGDSWLRDNLSLQAVCKRIDGYRAWKAAGGQANGNGHGARQAVDAGGRGPGREDEAVAGGEGERERIERRMLDNAKRNAPDFWARLQARRESATDVPGVRVAGGGGRRTVGCERIGWCRAKRRG